MKFFKKVLFNLYPKILLAQILYMFCMVFFIWYCLVHNPNYQYLVLDWEVLFFVIIALIFTSFFIPKILKIVFYKPRWDSQNSAWIALMFIVIMSMFSQFIVLKEQVLYLLGKTQIIEAFKDIKQHPESTFFVFKEDLNLSEVEEDAYFVHKYYSGKKQRNLNIDIYATKPIRKDNQTFAILCKKYETDYSGSISGSYEEQLVKQDFKQAELNLKNLNITINDTLKRIYKKFDREKFYQSFNLIENGSDGKYDMLLYSDKQNASFVKKGYLIFGGFFIFVNLILVLFLSTGMRFKD